MTRASKTRKTAQNASAASGNDFPQNGFATITSALAANPTLAPSVAARQLFPAPSAAKRGILRFKIKEQLEEGRGKHWQWSRGAVHEKNVGPDDEELEKVRLQFGYKEEEKGGPGKLYLTMLADSILPLPRDPMSGVVSPPILATTGIVPLSIFSTGPDIIGHYYDCIVAAKKEVILLTNYWQGGKNVDRIADALKELNQKVQARREDKAKESLKSRAGTANGDANPETSPNGHTFPTSQDNEGPNVKLDPPTLEEQIVVKLMWDRGPQTLADLFRLRKPVPPGMWKTNGLPEEKEIPNLKMEILNYHRPLMGTFHAKLLLVDRQVALINSNNIQDRPNVEACVRLEGDIVNAVYDHALISWGNPLQPPLPCLGMPAEVNPGSEAFASGEGHLPPITAERMKTMANQARLQLLQDDEDAEEEKELAQTPRGRMSFGDVVDSVMRPREASRDAEAGVSADTGVDSEKAARRAGQLWAQKVLGERFQGMRFSGVTHSEENENSTVSATAATSGSSSASPAPAPAIGQSSYKNRHFADVVDALMRKEGIKPGGWAEGALEAFGLGPSSSRNVADEVRKNRSSRKTAAARGINIPKAVQEEQDKSPRGPEGDGEKERDKDTVVETEEGQKGEGKSASPNEVFEEDDSASVSSDSSNGNKNEPEHTPGSMAYRSHHKRTRSTLSRASAAEKLENITKALDFANLSQVKGEIRADQLEELQKTQDPQALLEFLPYVLHKPHEPVPMALVNRRPHGTPGHSDIRNPQDAAWLAAFRYAEKHVFIQSPTLNASPIKAAVLACVRRHVRVELWLDLGFNDKSESMPFQGGTNEQVVTGMYRQLRREGKGDEKYLEVFWYTGKDMTRPLNAVRKQRNCHIKFAAVDGRVAILGSGNQDTQSWFHSQEINVMVDSTQIVTEWLDALRRNQSTHLYGKVDQRDGIWRGQSGAEKADTGNDN